MTQVFTCKKCGALLPAEFEVYAIESGRLIEEPECQAPVQMAPYATGECFRCRYAPAGRWPGRIMPTDPLIRRKVERQKALQEGGQYAPRRSGE